MHPIVIDLPPKNVGCILFKKKPITKFSFSFSIYPIKKIYFSPLLSPFFFFFSIKENINRDDEKNGLHEKITSKRFPEPFEYL